MTAKTENTETGNQSGFQPAPPDPDSSFSGGQDSALRMVANSLHRLNEAIVKAADSGLTVELMRASRYHAGSGSWGDQMVPIIERNSK
tara:strand:- start:385 stop:648 length:264 start_codon:yes stop_codon:yes gene_type:complete